MEILFNKFKENEKLWGKDIENKKEKKGVKNGISSTDEEEEKSVTEKVKRRQVENKKRKN